MHHQLERPITKVCVGLAVRSVQREAKAEPCDLCRVEPGGGDHAALPARHKLFERHPVHGAARPRLEVLAPARY
eukprot:3215310-Prymnesium_polylepis.1